MFFVRCPSPESVELVRAFLFCCNTKTFTGFIWIKKGLRTFTVNLFYFFIVIENVYSCSSHR